MDSLETVESELATTQGIGEVALEGIEDFLIQIGRAAEERSRWNVAERDRTAGPGRSERAAIGAVLVSWCIGEVGTRHGGVGVGVTGETFGQVAANLKDLAGPFPLLGALGLGVRGKGCPGVSAGGGFALEGVLGADL